MKPDAVIFDMDGLLIDTETLSQQAFHHAVKEHHLEGHDDLFRSLVGTNEPHHIKRIDEVLGHLLDARVFRKIWTEKFLQLTEKPVPVLPGVLETLEWLQNNNVKTAVATSTATQAAEKKLLNTGLRPYFQTVTCGDQVARSKPYPDIYLQAGKSIDADMSRSLGLEDSANGAKSAHAAGLHVIQIPNVVPASDEIRALGVRICDSMHDVLHLLQSNEALAQ